MKTSTSPLRKLALGLSTASLVALAAPAQAAPADFQIDPMHTFVYFEVVHFGTSTVRGRFNDVSGTISYDEAERKGKADITVLTGSIDSGVEDFNEHLKSPDFFDVGKTPKARFTSDRFEFDGETLRSISGQFTLLGKTLPITLEAKRFNCYDQPVLKARMCGGDFETTIKRSQWGMNWGIDMGIPDEVRLLIQIEAAKQ